MWQKMLSQLFKFHMDNICKVFEQKNVKLEDLKNIVDNPKAAPNNGTTVNMQEEMCKKNNRWRIIM